MNFKKYLTTGLAIVVLCMLSKNAIAMHNREQFTAFVNSQAQNPQSLVSRLPQDVRKIIVDTTSYAMEFDKLKMHCLLENPVGALVFLINNRNNPIMRSSEAVSRLICAGLDINKDCLTFRKNSNGFIHTYSATPLHYACLLGDEELARLFISFGARVYTKNNNQETPLTIACAFSDNLKLIELLLANGADLEEEVEGATALSTVIRKNRKPNKSALINYLLARKADPNASANTAKDCIVAFIEDEATLNLFKENGALIDKPNQRGATPLLHACSVGSLNKVRWLIHNGAHIDAQDQQGMTPLHYACVNRHIPIVQFLLERGAQVDLADNQGRTPLIITCRCWSDYNSEYFAQYEAIARLLLAHNAQVNLKDNFGESAFIRALRISDRMPNNYVDLLAEHGGRLTFADRWTQGFWGAELWLQAKNNPKTTGVIAIAALAMLGSCGLKIIQNISM